MAIQKTEAILLKKKDFRETSFILTFFTKDFGKIDGILKGARGVRPRSDANPIFFSLDQVVFYEKKLGGISIISQCETQEVFLNILKEWARTSSAYYMLELADVFTEAGDKSEDVFDSLYNSFRFLDKSDKILFCDFLESFDLADMVGPFHAPDKCMRNFFIKLYKLCYLLEITNKHGLNMLNILCTIFLKDMFPVFTAGKSLGSLVSGDA